MNEEHSSLGSDADDEEVDNDEADLQSNSGSEGQESEYDEDESIQGEESEVDTVGIYENEELCDEFINYAFGWSTADVTLEGLQERVGRIPAEIVAEQLLEYNVLHRYVGRSAECHPGGGPREEGELPANIELEVVQYLLELAPDAVNKADDGKMCGAHPGGKGAYPLHLACFNGDCPVSIIKLLLEENPSVANYSWEKGYKLPLCCYLQRACKHVAFGQQYDDGDFDEQFPAFPSVELDPDIVKLLVEAYPGALADASPNRGTPLNLLCQGYDVSMELAQLLTDNDRTCVEVEATDNESYSPIWSLLRNELVVPFPDEVFRYYLEYNPSSLEMGERDSNDNSDDDDSDDPFCIETPETPLNIACSNPNMTADTIGLIVKHQPSMARVEYRYNGCLPLHTLCKNKKLGEQSSVDILKLLVTAYPESVKKPIRSGGTMPGWIIGSDEGKYPIYLAEENMSFGFCKALLSERARLSSLPDVNILQIACLNKCSLETIKKLVENDRELISMRDGVKHIALHTAAKCASLEAIQYMADKNESTITMLDDMGELPLHKACRAGNIKAVEYLTKKDLASVTTRNCENCLPIHLLCDKSNKSKGLMRSIEYTEAIFQLLMAYPVICDC